jgi:dipeptidase D
MNLSELKPSVVWNHFENLCAIPRPSKHEQEAARYVIDFARLKGLDYRTDHAGNVLVIKNASSGRENRSTFVLQSHLDMVVQHTPDTPHDAEKDQIQPYVDGEWVRARGTTLGADNGIGAAIMLAILEDQTLKHGPIEALFTVDEETAMTGAFALGTTLLNGKFLINLDTENENELCIGCAGGLDAIVSVPVEYEATGRNEHAGCEIVVGGLKGGHSGIDIHLGRGNAIKILNRLIVSLQNRYDLRIASVNAGSVRNAIPRDALAQGVVARELLVQFTAAVMEFQKMIVDELAATDPGITCTVREITPPSRVFTRPSQQRLLDATYACPNGIMRMSDRAPGVVETSNNLAIVAMNDTSVQLQCLLRSSLESAKQDLADMMMSIARLAGAKIEFGGNYPGWKPDPSSRIVKLLQDTYHDLFGQSLELKSVHAGLECGIIGAKYPGMEMVSCGPDIKFPHSPDECLRIQSVERFWTFLTTAIERGFREEG